MFSFSHIAIVFLIALLVFGPEKLPEVARIVGKALGDFRRASTDFRRVIEDEFAEIDRQNREKEELARRKALEASSTPPATLTPGAVSSDPESLAQGSSDPDPLPAPVPEPSVSGAVPRSADRESAAPEVEKSPTQSAASPADGHSA